MCIRDRESALAHWLYHDEIWLRGNAKAKAEVLLAIARVRHALVLFGCLLYTSQR